MAYVTEPVTGEKQLKTGQNTKETKYLGGIGHRFKYLDNTEKQQILEDIGMKST